MTETDLHFRTFDEALAYARSLGRLRCEVPLDDDEINHILIQIELAVGLTNADAIPRDFECVTQQWRYVPTNTFTFFHDKLYFDDENEMVLCLLRHR